MKSLLALLMVTLLTGCASSMVAGAKKFEAPEVQQGTYLQQNKIDVPADGPIPVAVYSFQDKTGQRKNVPNIASFSSAVTQGADAYLIKALQDVGEGRWFTVVERVGLDNLIKERQMIRQMREQYQGRDAKQLPPMIFAGILMEGAVTGYDSNVMTGGYGMRVLGIGAQTQYQSDSVTVTLRTVSVNTGEVLTTVTITKTILSYMDKFGMLRFVEAGEQAIESESGVSVNESINRATDLAIQAAVIATIKEGVRKGHWSYKGQPIVTPLIN
jgi:curli production assembly/transport component CsgG